MRVPVTLRTALRAVSITVTAAVATAGLAVIAPDAALATPVRNAAPWSVLLCKFSDRPAEPHDAAWFSRFLTHAGVGWGGVADYLNDQSAGRVSLVGSVVRGWYTESHTKAQEAAVDRWTRIQHCVDAAAAGGYTVPPNHRIVAIINDAVDSGAAGGRVLLDPGAWNVGFAAHEMLHGYGLGHSYSNDLSYRNAPWSAPGEYDDPWDEMSAMNIYAFNTAYFGTSAVGLSAYHRDELGWLGRTRVFTMGADGVGSRTIGLAPLELAGGGGPQLIRIPFNPGDLFNYYTVEYRRRVGWSGAIPGPVVLIHEVRNGNPILQRNVGGDRQPATPVNANGVHINVLYATASSAAVSITTDIVTRCLSGWVWREANATDRVCVPPATRSQVAYDNYYKAWRWYSGPYGPHTCISGYVWREAFVGDDVCVYPWQRSQAWSDNAAAASRANPARLVYGPNTCISGYVWREADDRDYVCVTPVTRSRVAYDNYYKAGRWYNGPYGPHTCISGYVWREAFIGDDVCVFPWQRSEAWADNTAGPGRVLRPGG